MTSKRFYNLERMTAYDTRVLHWLLTHTGAARLARGARWISRLGDGPLYAVLGAVLLLADGGRGTLFFSHALTAFALELPLYVLLKNLIRRPRPLDTGKPLQAFIQPSDRFSFPSGHTAAAFVMATLVLVHYPAWMLPAVLLAPAIGLSRVMLGVHYPSDIFAGAALGALCTVAVAPTVL